MKRQFSPYEQNQLRQYGVSLEKAMEYGEMPVEYITGHCEFYGRDFLINKHVLIPRVEGEDLIHLALKCITPSLPLTFDLLPFTFSDLGTGSGILGITLYEELTAKGLHPSAYLSDISKHTLAIAKKNIRRLTGKKYYNRSDRNEYNTSSEFLFLLKSDLFSRYPENLQFDLIVANLPYIPSDRIAKLPSSVRDFEPHLALDGGFDGLKLIKKCIQQIPARLKQNGIAILEIDETHALPSIPKVQGLLYNVERDHLGKNRFLVMTLLQHPHIGGQSHKILHRVG